MTFNYTKVGDIALLHLSEELEPVEYEIARNILHKERGVKVVLRKFERHGEFRKQRVKILIGERTDTLHKEYGVTMRVDLMETYFSEKEKTERQRLKDAVREGEKILVLFAGVGAIPLVIAKERDVKIVAVEKNEKSFSLLKENIHQNALKGSITPILEDVYSYRPQEEFDRVIAPQPYRHHSFHHISPLVKEKGFLHYYTFLGTGEELPDFEGFEIRQTKKLSSYAPGVVKVCVDMVRLPSSRS